jgi:hypothetical protein
MVEVTAEEVLSLCERIYSASRDREIHHQAKSAFVSLL